MAHVAVAAVVSVLTVAGLEEDTCQSKTHARIPNAEGRPGKPEPFLGERVLGYASHVPNAAEAQGLRHTSAARMAVPLSVLYQFQSPHKLTLAKGPSTGGPKTLRAAQQQNR